MLERYRYPDEWEQMANAAKERAGWMCEECLVPHGTIVRSPRTGNPYVVYLQAAHLEHDRHNPDPRLVAVCPTCHARYYRRTSPQPYSRPLLCPRRRALRRRWEQQKASPSSLATRGASTETATGKHQPRSSHPHSSRVDFGWQIEGGFSHE